MCTDFISNFVLNWQKSLAGEGGRERERERERTYVEKH